MTTAPASLPSPHLTLRQSMAVLHTWVGVAVSAILFAMFWMGTLSVFDREIDRWMIPQTRLEASAAPASFDRQALPAFRAEAPDAARWNWQPPRERQPLATLGWDDPAKGYQTRHLDPATGTLLPPPESLAGTGFIFPFHFSFHATWMDIGYWIVGFAAMAMLVLIVSGVIIHRKLFAEFFVFRPRKHARRSTLDLHNMTSLVALPFHIILPLSGLYIFFGIYLPWSVAVPFGGDAAAMDAAVYGSYSRPALSSPTSAQASIDAMIADAEVRWSARHGIAARADVVSVTHPGDAAGFVTVRRVFPSRQVTMDADVITYDLASGAVLKDWSAGPVRRAHGWLAGLHFIQFDHWPLRWLYFLAGLSGCAMIATGLLFWLRAREGKHTPGSASFRTMEALTIGGVTGIIVATGAFLVANRLLPEGATLWGESRAGLEVWAFWLVWLATFLHAAVRRAAAWAEQCAAIALLAMAAVLLNAATTGDHVLAAAARGQWAVAGMDLMLLAAAGMAGWAMLRLRPARVAEAALPDPALAPAE
ncbi:PepSY-associated TM helix domain-containing protein [Erythrobacter sp. W302b]|uniref:PepSY-associated TM helix domain-containing protein n=1 Tax=Erythrobacter sp. W302b TaxID=3389874 RepID=UPI00396AF974